MKNNTHMKQNNGKYSSAGLVLNLLFKSWITARALSIAQDHV